MTTTLPDAQTLDLDLQSGWLTIWFNQPDKRNALTEELVADLTSVLLVVREDRAVRGITLRGRGGVFCAGGDLKMFKQAFQEEASRDDVVALSKGGAGLFDLINTMPQVIVALVEGPAYAGGFGIVCCADVVICDMSAKFALTETAIGLTPAQITPFVVQRLGLATARRLILTASRFTGKDAGAIGLADFTADGMQAIEAVEASLRSKVLACAPGAVADAKHLLLTLPSMDRQAQIDAAAENFADRMVSEEAREGIAAFVQKRKPDWAPDD